MRKLLCIILVIICAISLTVNVLMSINYNHVKKTYQLDICGHLVNVSKVIDNILLTDSDSQRDYNLDSLERECIQLDDLHYGLSVLSSNNTSSYTFDDFQKDISKIVGKENKNSDKLQTDLAQYKEKIQKLLAGLSVDGEIKLDNVGNISLNPNYSLNSKATINLINSMLSNMSKST